MSGLPQGLFCYFFPLNGPYILFCCMPHNFWLKIGHFKYYDVLILETRLFCSSTFVVHAHCELQVFVYLVTFLNNFLKTVFFVFFGLRGLCSFSL